MTFNVSDLVNHEIRLKQVLNHFGRLDILVNNAGRAQGGHFEQTNSDIDHELFETNVFGLIKLTRLVVNYWLNQDPIKTNESRHVVFTSSMVAKVGGPFGATYAATKFALHGYIESARTELWNRRIRFTTVCPGPVVSEIRQRTLTTIGGKLEHLNLYSAFFTEMDTKRCAKLMLIAIANQLSECWIANQPVLMSNYAAQYFPSLTMYFGPRLFSMMFNGESILEKQTSMSVV